MRFLINHKSSRGDTIVEVLISMAVLAVVLGTAYASTSRSFHAGLNSQYRDQALLIAQQQVELIKTADISGSPAIGIYKTGANNFCLDSSQISTAPNYGKKDLSSSQPTCTTPVGAPAASQSQFNLADSYDSSSQVFAITTSWEAENQRTSQVVLYYKASGSYVP